MNDLRRLKDQNIFVEYSKKKNDLDVFREQATIRIQEMSVIAFDILNNRLTEDFYDVRFDAVKYQELLNRVYERIQVARKHPNDALARLSFGGEEVIGEAYTATGRKVAFSVTYDELTMTDGEYKSYIKKIITQTEKEILKEPDCLCMLRGEGYQLVVDKQRAFFRIFDSLSKIGQDSQKQLTTA